MLGDAGFVASTEEAAELRDAARGDERRLAIMVSRRLRGEPLAWITGVTRFCGLNVRVEPGVYVPRWQSEPLALRAVERLPPRGLAVDVATGSGALAMVLSHRRPRAVVFATDCDERAVACARRNGVDARHGDLFDPLPGDLAGRVDVVTGVVPYVPTDELAFLPRDTMTFESSVAYDGGKDGLALARRVVAASPRLLVAGGVLLLELGGAQDALLREDLARAGFRHVTVWRDEDDDLRGIEAVFEPPTDSE